jgi:flagellar hook protein FlgE
MSLFGSLFTGVSALTAQSQAMGTISNNIANVNTVGYKRIETSFSSLVTTEAREGRYTPGSVTAHRENTLDQQGAIQQTSSSTDVAVSGNGFFIVQRTPDGLQDTLYTRSGGFSEDESGFLRNAAGFYLMGWPLDADGNLPSSQADLSSLQPVDVAFLGGLTRPTSTAELALNLNASETDKTFPISGTQAPDFTRGLRVFDSLGAGQDIEFRFTKHSSPSAYSQSVVGGTGLAIDTVLSSVADVDNTETITVTVGAQTDTFTVTATSTTQDFLDFVNSSATLGDISVAELTSTGQVRVTAANLADNVTIADGGTVIGTGAATALGFATTAAPAAPTILPNGLANLENTPNPQSWWQLDLVDVNSGASLASGSINFNQDGSINANADAEGEIKITLNDIEWGNGSEPQDIDVLLGSVSQFSGEYNVIFSEQNGAELGLRTGVEVDRDGVVSARFSNGQTSQLYKLPLATFTNVNGLAEETGNVYSESSDSGSFNLREAGQGGAGLVSSASLEASNVDLADEFSRMIIVQRAYSAGTKIISTADEMTEELLRLR